MTNATDQQKVSEYILDRMIRLDSSVHPTRLVPSKIFGAIWPEDGHLITKDSVAAQANTPWTATHGMVHQIAARLLLSYLALPGTYRPAREHIPQNWFHYVPLTVTAGTTVTAISSRSVTPSDNLTGEHVWLQSATMAMRDTPAWNTGTNSITLSSDEDELYLMVIAVPKPMKIAEPVGAAYIADYACSSLNPVSFTNATPNQCRVSVQSHSGMHQHANGLGWVSDSATVDSSAYVGPNAQFLTQHRFRGNARIEEYGVVKNSAR